MQTVLLNDYRCHQVTTYNFGRGLECLPYALATSWPNIQRWQIFGVKSGTFSALARLYHFCMLCRTYKCKRWDLTRPTHGPPQGMAWNAQYFMLWDAMRKYANAGRFRKLTFWRQNSNDSKIHVNFWLSECRKCIKVSALLSLWAFRADKIIDRKLISQFCLLFSLSCQAWLHGTLAFSERDWVRVRALYRRNCSHRLRLGECHTPDSLR